jgi:hypothetical protein
MFIAVAGIIGWLCMATIGVSFAAAAKAAMRPTTPGAASVADSAAARFRNACFMMHLFRRATAGRTRRSSHSMTLAR